MKQSLPLWLLSQGFKCYRQFKNGIKDRSLTECEFDNFFSTANSWSWWFVFKKDDTEIKFGISGVSNNPPTLLTRCHVIIYHFGITTDEKRFIDSDDNLIWDDDFWNRLLMLVDYNELLNFIKP